MCEIDKKKENMTIDYTPPLVSIGMPTYNGERTICSALDSLLAQDFKDFELIISDNASSDSTENICQQYAARNPRIRYYRNEMNIEWANFNRVLHLARGKYFMWASDDDLWEPSYVSCMVEALDSNSDAVLSFCRFDIYSDKPPVIDQDTANWSKIIGRERFYRSLHTCSPLQGTMEIIYIYGLIRKEILLKCGGIEMRVEMSMDSPMVTLIHLLYYGKFVRVDKLLFHKRLKTYRRSIPVIPPLAQRLAKQSLFSVVMSYLKWLNMTHEYYHIRRVIVKETSFQIPEKIILLMALYRTEMFFYFNNFLLTSLKMGTVIRALWIKMQDTGLNLIKRLTQDIKRM